MATIPYTRKEGLNATTFAWEGLATGDEGEPVKIEYSKLTAQVVGALAGSTASIQGSIDGVNYVTLNDESVPANPCSFTAAGLKGVLQKTLYIKPVVAAGAAADIDVLIFNIK